MIEGKYLLGLPIDLRDKGLGIVHQPIYKLLVEKQVDLEVILKPFLMKKEMLKGENDEFNKIFEQLGDYGCLFLIDEQSPENKVIDSLVEALKLLYDTDDVHVNPNTNFTHVHQNYNEFKDEIIIEVEKFSILSDLVYEIFKLEKPKFEDKSKMDEVDLEFERRRNKHKKKSKKKEKVTKLHDIVNFIIHCEEFTGGYKEIGEMTIYQIKNTYETLVAKHNFEYYNMLKFNQFDISKMKCEDWRTKKIVKDSELFAVNIKNEE